MLLTPDKLTTKEARCVPLSRNINRHLLDALVTETLHSKKIRTKPDRTKVAPPLLPEQTTEVTNPLQSQNPPVLEIH
jgi:hypothetical protein